VTEPASPTPPPGFEPADVHSPFFRMVGPLWMRHDARGQLELALVIDERHLNSRGHAHGGLLAAFADISLVRVVSRSQDPPVLLATASLSIDYADAVRIGETVISTVDIQRIGRRVAFANCYLNCGERRVVRASAVLAALD
jgi:acyl-coenzyme A thioesterase 13